jgi:RHS repeat-associated protein
MRAALHRAAKARNPDRGRDLDDGRRRAHRAPPRSGAHASRWCVDELAEHAARPPRLRADRRARHNSFSSRARVGPSELYGYDAHRNITVLTDATGTLTDTYDYDAWGNLVQATGSTPNTRLYEGQEVDPDLGLINLRARQYSPNTGRFLTLDPLMGRLLKPTSLNRYLSADADPENLWDPNGSQVAIEYTTTAQAGLAIVTAATGAFATQLLAKRFIESIGTPDMTDPENEDPANQNDCYRGFRLTLKFCKTLPPLSRTACVAAATFTLVACALQNGLSL